MFSLHKNMVALCFVVSLYQILNYEALLIWSARVGRDGTVFQMIKLQFVNS